MLISGGFPNNNYTQRGKPTSGSCGNDKNVRG